MRAKNIGITVLTVCFIAVALTTVGQTRNELAATANIPFEFFIDDERMPQGDYTISYTPSGILLFQNAKTRSAKQAFTARSGDPVDAKDARLVFVLYKQQYRFVGLRGIDATWRVTAQYYTALPEGASRHEIPVAYSATRKQCGSYPVPRSDSVKVGHVATAIAYSRNQRNS